MAELRGGALDWVKLPRGATSAMWARKVLKAYGPAGLGRFLMLVDAMMLDDTNSLVLEDDVLEIVADDLGFYDEVTEDGLTGLEAFKAYLGDLIVFGALQADDKAVTQKWVEEAAERMAVARFNGLKGGRPTQETHP